MTKKHHAIKAALIAQAQTFDVENNWHTLVLVRVKMKLRSAKWGSAFDKGEYALAARENEPGKWILWTPRHNDWTDAQDSILTVLE